jgi:predicted amidohydrolase YtcJ
MTLLTASDFSADLVFVNGSVITCDEARPRASGLAVREDRIAWVGDGPLPADLMGPRTRVVDLRGRALIPGFNDSHNHMLRAGLALRNVRLGDCKALANLLGKIEARASMIPTGQWVVPSGGWHEASLAEKRLPSRGELDAAVPNHPVYIPRGGHTAVANSLALTLAGVDEKTPDPPGGAFIKDPGTGRLTGQLFETPAMLRLERLLPNPTVEDIEHGILADRNQSRRLAAMDVAIAAHSLHLYKLGQNMVKHWGPRRATAAYP